MICIGIAQAGWKIKYRTSFGQNGLQHTKKVAQLMGFIAGQLGLDTKIAIRAGLLHDIGKVVSQEVEEGTHAIVVGLWPANTVS